MSKIDRVNVGGVSYDIEDRILNSKFFVGTQDEWDALTEEQKNSFIFAEVLETPVEPYVELTENDIQNISDVLGEDSEITSDLTEEEALEITNEIIEGSV